MLIKATKRKQLYSDVTTKIHIERLTEENEVIMKMSFDKGCPEVNLLKSLHVKPRHNSALKSVTSNAK